MVADPVVRDPEPAHDLERDPDPAINLDMDPNPVLDPASYQCHGS